MEPILSPVQEVAEVASITEQDPSWLDLVEQGSSSHTRNDHQETVLQSRAPNTLYGSTEPRRQVDLPWRRTYQQNELFRIGASVRPRVVRKSRSAQEDLSHLNATGPRALRRSASAYNDFLQATAKSPGESLTRRSSTQSEGLQAPVRQPTNPTGDVEWNRARGFARFIKNHASPRHHRVTAGGRIVPAIPNTPPPTFHDEFLDAFLQSGSGEQHQEAFESSSMQSSMIAGLGEPLVPLHAGAYINANQSPLLRIPPGHEIMQISTEGTVVLARRGTTIYQYELTDNGETSCKIVTREPRRPASQTTLLTPTSGMWSYTGDAISQGHEQSFPSIYGSDLLATGSANLTSGYQAPHETSHLSLQIRMENELQQIFLSSYQATISSCFNSYSHHSGQSVSASHVGELQQQLRALGTSLEGWTTILLDYERLLLVPSALGHAGTKSNQIKRDMIMVKIEELMKRKFQIETHMAIAHPTALVQTEADEGQQASSHVPTEVDHEGQDNRSFHQYSDIGSAPMESQTLSALAPMFIPSGRGIRLAQLDEVDVEQQESDRSVVARPAGTTEDLSV